MIARICDRCGGLCENAEKYDQSDEGRELELNKIIDPGHDSDIEYKLCDLCSECYESLRKWFSYTKVKPTNKIVIGGEEFPDPDSGPFGKIFGGNIWDVPKEKYESKKLDLSSEFERKFGGGIKNDRI